MIQKLVYEMIDLNAELGVFAVALGGLILEVVEIDGMIYKKG